MAKPGGQSSERMLGAVLVSTSAAVFGLAGALTKSIDTDPLTITCWRGWVLAGVGALASIAFISAFKTGYVANVAIIYATVPFAAAILSRLMLGERFRVQTMIAAAVSLLGVLVMVSSGLAGSGLVGDAFAVAMTILSALYMVLLRKFTETPLVWAGAVSAFLLFGLGWLVADPLSISARDALLLMAFGSSFALAVILWTEGARLIPASEAGLLGSAEVPFAILFAWLLLSELPPSASLVGGSIVLAAVIAHAGLDWRAARLAAVRGG